VGAAVIRSEGDAPATVAAAPGSPRYPLLDGLRAVAAGLVLVYHGVLLADNGNGRLVRDLGQQGVAIFFVLSGFLLYGPFVRARVHGHGLPSLRDYARRRAVRIVPAYWLALTYALLVAGATSVTAGHTPIYYLLLQDYVNGARYHGLPVTWSLSIEATFYILLPLLAYIAIRLARWGSERWQMLPEALIIAGFVIVPAALHFLHPGAPPTILSYTDWFAGGMLLALVAVHLREPRSLPVSVSVAVWVIGVVVFVGETHTQPFGGYFGHVLMAVTAVAIVTPAVFPAQRGVVTAALELPGLAWLGTVSYGIYLWHMPIMSTILKVHHLGAVPLILIAAALTVVIAAASYRFLEAPLIRRFRTRRAWNAGRPRLTKTPR